MATRANSTAGAGKSPKAGTGKTSKAGTGKSSKAGPGTAQKKGRSAGGRTTKAGQRVQSQRYTPPIPKNVKSSSRWLGVLILVLFGLGVAVVILNYAGLLPGGVNNLWLIAAIAAIFVGLILATRYH
jgi:hypothetical protein